MYERTIEAIMKLFGDTSQSPEETLADLRGLRNEIDILIYQLENEIN